MATNTMITATALALCMGVSSAVMAETPYMGDGHTMITPDELKWGPVGSMAPGAQIAVLEGDLGTAEPFTMRLKLPADYVIAPHIHPAYERVTVLSGTFYFAHGEEFDRGQRPAGGQSGDHVSRGSDVRLYRRRCGYPAPRNWPLGH